MMHAPIQPDEGERLSALQQNDLVGSDIDLRLDTVITLARNLFQVPIATVSLVGDEKQLFPGAQGLDVCETSRDISFCAHPTAPGPQSNVIAEWHLFPAAATVR